MAKRKALIAIEPENIFQLSTFIFWGVSGMNPLNGWETHEDQCQTVFHEGRAATEEARNEHQDGDSDENVNANVVRVDVEDGDPFLKAGLDTNPNGEGKQPQPDELK